MLWKQIAHAIRDSREQIHEGLSHGMPWQTDIQASMLADVLYRHGEEFSPQEFERESTERKCKKCPDEGGDDDE